jgi:hypothetical protein
MRDWVILGKRGAIYAVPENFQIVVLSGSATGWTWAKKLIGMVTQDGDEEGSIILAGCRPRPRVRR